MATTYRQDGPPKGGFEAVSWKRVMAKSRLKSWHFLAGMTLWSVVNFNIAKSYQHRRLEHRWAYNDSRLALQALIEAEGDRALLRRMKHNEEAEAAIMADIPGWIPGSTVMHSDRFVGNMVDPHRDYSKIYPHKSSLRRFYETTLQVPKVDLE